MLLIELKNYLQQHQQASLHDVALHFQIPEGAVYDMLDHWVRKGYVEIKSNTVCSCGGCGGCSASGCGSDIGDTIYHWK